MVKIYSTRPLRPGRGAYGELTALKPDVTHWLTEPEYEVLRYRLEAAHASAEAALVEARQRVRLNERQGE
jgi:hypothetical protein